MLKKTDIKAILWAGIEDYTALWQVVWELNTLHAQNTLEENKQLGVLIVNYLFSENMIDFMEGPWDEQKPMRRVTDQNKIQQVLLGTAYWTPPTSLISNYIAITAKKKGIEYYNTLTFTRMTHSLTLQNFLHNMVQPPQTGVAPPIGSAGQ